jgi:predicted nucleotidyltransferase
METELHTPTIRDAEELTSQLAGAFPAIEAVLLCGSVARGDANPWSDIDLLVTSSDPKLTVAELRHVISERSNVSLIYYQTPSFATSCQRHPLFTAHLKKEGVVLFDPVGVLRRMLDTPTFTKADVAEEIRQYRAKLAPYRHPKRYNNNFLFCLSHLYSIGKGVIMLGLASQGVLEFNRDAAFERFATLHPELAEQVATVARLRPFYRLVSGRKSEVLPFSYYDAATKMEEAVNAIDFLAERATCL